MRRVICALFLTAAMLAQTADGAPTVDERISFYIIPSCFETLICIQISGNQIIRSDGYTISVINYYYDNRLTGEHVQGTPFGDYNLVTVQASHSGLIVQGGNIALSIAYTDEFKENYTRSAIRKWGGVLSHWRGDGVFQSASMSGSIGNVVLPVTDGSVDQETLKQIR